MVKGKSAKQVKNTSQSLKGTKSPLPKSAASQNADPDQNPHRGRSTKRKLSQTNAEKQTPSPSKRAKEARTRSRSLKKGDTPRNSVKRVREPSVHKGHREGSIDKTSSNTASKDQADKDDVVVGSSKSLIK